MEVKVSFIVLTLNEERCIRRCIDSIKEVAYEIIVVDTGSKDKTIEILRNKYKNIKIYKYKWGLDFSQARNFGLSKATGELVFYIDADEWLCSSVSKEMFFQEFKRIKRVEQANVVFYPRIKNHDDKLTLGVSRVFFKKYGFKWYGRVHEELRIKGIELKFEELNVTLNHDGYKNDVFERKKKKKRNISLLQKTIKEEKDNYRWEFFLIRESIGVYSREESINLIKSFRVKTKKMKKYKEENYTLLLELIRLKIFDEDFDEKLISEINDWRYENTNYLYYNTLYKLIRFRKGLVNDIGKIIDLRYGSNVEEYSLNDNKNHLDFLLAILFYNIGDINKSNYILNTLKEKYYDTYILDSFGYNWRNE